MIAITPEPVIGMSRNTDRHGPESPIQGLLEFCVSFCRSTVDSRVRPCTAVYRVQKSYEINPLFVECFGGVTGQRSNQLNYVPNRGINDLA